MGYNLGTMKRIISIGIILLTVVGAGWLYLINQQSREDTSNNTISESKEKSADLSKYNIDKTEYSTSDPESLWVIVNKEHPVPQDFEPTDLELPLVKRQPDKSSDELRMKKDASVALQAMFAEADKQGLDRFQISSGYRAYDLQKWYYESLVKSLGQAEADKISAKPGTSEHQTGWTADISIVGDDICRLEVCFGETKEGLWIEANAHKFGFIIRYPKDKINVTGYNYEPWHIRYVGDKLAQELFQSNLAMEEYFDY